MSDKIKSAARRRMAETGEPYTVARREVMRQHAEALPELVRFSGDEPVIPQGVHLDPQSAIAGRDMKAPA